MIPSFSRMLMGAADTLSQDVAPHIKDAPDAIGHMGTIGLILSCMAQAVDSAAEAAIAEQEALRAFFREATSQPLREDLLQEVRIAGIDSARPSLKVSALEAQNAELTRLLMEVLQYLEAEHFDWAIALEAKIWALLKASAERRALYLPVL